MLWPCTAKLLKIIVRSSPMPDPVKSTIASVGASLLGGAMSSDAAEKAAGTQADAARYAADVQRKMYERGVSLQDPFRRAGMAAQNQLLTYLGITPTLESEGDISNRLSYEMPNWGKLKPEQKTAAIKAELDKQQAFIETAQKSPQYGALMRDFSMQDFQQDPGYGFRMSEGMKALDRSAAARGGLLSGSALKNAQRFGQDLASQEYMNAFDRYQTNRANKLNPLQSLAGVSQTTAKNLATQGNLYGQGASEAAYQGANARASGYIGSANAWTNALGGVTNAYNQYQLMNQLGGMGGPTYGSGAGQAGGGISLAGYNPFGG